MASIARTPARQPEIIHSEHSADLRGGGESAVRQEEHSLKSKLDSGPDCQVRMEHHLGVVYH